MNVEDGCIICEVFTSSIAPSTVAVGPTPFWNQLHLSPIYDEHGELAYYFASQIDVTAYRRIQTLEEAEHRLLLEVDHRTKNVLAIVDSIVRLSRSDTAANYAASVQQRVQALSRTHMLLAEKGWQEVEIADIIRTQVQVFGSGDIEITGSPVMMPAPSAQPIGLVIHELAANAAVHGALSQRRGHLEISWVPNSSGLTLTWSAAVQNRRRSRGGASETWFWAPLSKSSLEATYPVSGVMMGSPW